MPVINCKIELKLKWTICCVLSATGADNANYNSNNIIFTIKNTKLYVSVVTLSTRDYQKLSKRLGKGYRYFLESNFVGVNRLFVLVYTNEDCNAKKFNARKHYSPKGIIDNYYVIINRKTFYDQPVDSDIKRYQEIRKPTTGQSEDYPTGCFLDYDYIKTYYRLMIIDLSKQKELDADRKAIQQIEVSGQLKKLDDDDDGAESLLILTILEKIKETRLKFSQGSVTVL